MDEFEMLVARVNRLEACSGLHSEVLSSLCAKQDAVHGILRALLGLGGSNEAIRSAVEHELEVVYSSALATNVNHLYQNELETIIAEMRRLLIVEKAPSGEDQAVSGEAA